MDPTGAVEVYIPSQISKDMVLYLRYRSKEVGATHLSETALN